MRISDHLLNEARQSPSPNHSGGITPLFIVQHYTAGFSLASAVSWLRNPASRASAHVVVGNDGSIVQLVPFNKKAWHAGPSKYDGVVGLNGHSIGIEITNVGWLRKQPDGSYRDWTFYDSRLKPNAPIYHEGKGELAGRELIAQSHPRVGGGVLYWPTYTDAQMDAVEDLTAELLAEYPTIRDIVSHEEIDTRGWKTDPGPAFPMQRMKRLLGNDRSDDGEAAGAPDDTDRLGAALEHIIERASVELGRNPASKAHRRWRLAEIRDTAIKALNGD